jgi:uncharacterized membrane protein YeaQ/YmgE (transglycosylase-associated protein family)
MFINLICWIAVGLVAGFIVSKFVNERGDDPMLGILLGAAGAVVGGFLFGMFGSQGLSEFNMGSVWVALLGAAAALAAWHAVRAYRSRA